MHTNNVGYRFPFYVSQLFCAQQARSSERPDSCYTYIPVVQLSKRPIVTGLNEVNQDCLWFPYSLIDSRIRRLYEKCFIIENYSFTPERV